MRRRNVHTCMGEKEEKEAETKVEKNESFETRALIEKVVAYPSHR